MSAKSLQDFIVRGEVLKLYREFLRATKTVTKDTQGE